MISIPKTGAHISSHCKTETPEATATVKQSKAPEPPTDVMEKSKTAASKGLKEALEAALARRAAIAEQAPEKGQIYKIVADNPVPTSEGRLPAPPLRPGPIVKVHADSPTEPSRLPTSLKLRPIPYSPHQGQLPPMRPGPVVKVHADEPLPPAGKHELPPMPKGPIVKVRADEPT